MTSSGQDRLAKEASAKKETEAAQPGSAYAASPCELAEASGDSRDGSGKPENGSASMNHPSAGPRGDDRKQRSERHSRIRLAKRILRPLPRRATLHRYPVIKWFAAAARKKPFLWSFRISEVSPALYIGCILAFLPAYGVQTALAFLLAMLCRANLLVVMGLQFITNPLTFLPIYWFTYQVGKILVHKWDLNEYQTLLGTKAYPLVIGGIAVGLLVALVLDLVYRFAAKSRKPGDLATAAKN